MRVNSKFSIAVHVLALLGINKDSKEKNTSELISKSVGTNPVVIRRLISNLKREGLVNTQPGIAGSTLAKDPSNITLLDIYKAVKPSEDALVFDFHEKTSKECPVGKNIKNVLKGPFIESQKAMENKLAEYNLKDIIDEIKYLYIEEI
ncbi:MAG: Rrf2 family transcriptional regulator [Clostridioides sp.]|jgi:Rrf2 family protein|nr:Rrf2 family transcriptional regulator [Clostridioides sp.]